MFVLGNSNNHQGPSYPQNFGRNFFSKENKEKFWAKFHVHLYILYILTSPSPESREKFDHRRVFPYSLASKLTGSIGVDPESSTVSVAVVITVALAVVPIDCLNID